MLDRKHKKLQGILKDNRRVLIAFSGGVDSSLLARVAKEALGRNALAVTIDCEMVPRRELKGARAMAKAIGIKHRAVKYRMLKNKEFTRNPQNRCYYCKRKIMGILLEAAEKEGSVLMDGTNADDVRGRRPGLKALRELGVLSPLAMAGISKNEARKLSRKLRLRNFDRPEMTCLATRIPTGETITKERLKRIEKAEEFLQGLRIRDLRVRDHDNIARIEVKREKFKIIFNNREKIIKEFKGLGFSHVCLDLRGGDE